MKATELIGKIAIRTEPTKTCGDWSYTESPLLILDATESHVLAVYANKEELMVKILGNKPFILRADFVDGWADYQPIQDKIDEYNNKKEENNNG